MSFLSKDTDNFIINGDMRVSQRGDYTSPIAYNDSGYYLDRWKIFRNTVTANVQQVATSQPPELSGSYSMKLIASSTNNGSIVGAQYVEDYNLLEGKTVTFSAYVKTNSSNARVALGDSVIGGSSEGYSGAHPGDGSWKRLSITRTIPLGVSYLLPAVRLDDGSSGTVSISSGDYIEFTGAKLEFGSRPTPFVQRPYYVEHTLCKRYWERVSGTSIFSYSFPALSLVVERFAYTVEKRINPSVYFSFSRTLASGYPVSQGSTTKECGCRYLVQNADNNTYVTYSHYADAEI